MNRAKWTFFKGDYYLARALTQNQKLKQSALNIDKVSIEDLIKSENQRIKKFTFSAAGLYFDFTKSNLSCANLEDLMTIADKKSLLSKRKKMFDGGTINFTENRAVMHFALRNLKRDWVANEVSVSENIRRARADASAFANRIFDGSIKAKNGKTFSAILHIGIGGSDLGPRLIYEALRPIGKKDAIQIRFCANVEPTDFLLATEGLDPHTTLIVCVSKTFTTIETLTNFKLAREWLQAAIGADDKDHLVAISAAPEKAIPYGIDENRIFGFEDWVGGRYSLWSSVGLSLEMAFGKEVIDQLHLGAMHMDEHFETAPMTQNAPIFGGLMSYWYHSYLGYQSRAIIPYAARLRLLPQFLQQLDMESNGKTTGINGTPVKSSCPIVWGAEGTNAQHAFFQHLHQSPIVTPIEFVLIGDSQTPYDVSNRLTHANALAQAEALMRGKSLDAVIAHMKGQGKSSGEIGLIAPHRVFSGNRPSTTILLPKLDAYSFGAYLSYCEHKTFVEGVLWGINSFDQWGVELGKTIALEIDADIENGPSSRRDKSTAIIINKLRE